MPDPASDMTDIAARIRSFLLKEIIFDEAYDLKDGTPLLAGLVDSIGFMDLVAFLEDDFGVVLENDDMSSNNFGTVQDISKLVRDRMQQGQPASGE